ncbi:hypothetical protein O181_124629 [Austropuccinia psidii MF-1]|uniref:Uncharacterized protein n=1 Tax=Austropuccinia psidii MF-1 TaxID=1389203 RepID=A0A9Q3Q4G1_9BASI|nr:hypothetical protein [Austropuccinia psidii MF-1]
MIYGHFWSLGSYGPYAAVRGPWGLLEAPWAQIFCGPRMTKGPGIGPNSNLHHTWPGPIDGVQDNQDPGLPKVAGEALVMSSKMTELTESSPSAPPPSVLCDSGVFSKLSSPSMAPSGHFDPSQTYDGFREVEVLDPACTECLAKGKDCFQHYNP